MIRMKKTSQKKQVSTLNFTMELYHIDKLLLFSYEEDFTFYFSLVTKKTFLTISYLFAFFPSIPHIRLLRVCLYLRNLCVVVALS